eukprot:GHVR01054062.1.p1 GENE.GHVR01054062.1~~GHVR01054062.1.p1  ORF type:complete len:122 (+),score=22.41 GHVR01054062.1:210-575(+)
MFSNQIASFLRTYIGKYVDGFQDNDVEVSLLKGKAVFNCLLVRPIPINDALKISCFPLELSWGYIDSLTIQIHVLNKRIEIKVDNVTLLLKPKTSSIDAIERYWVNALCTGDIAPLPHPTE